MKRSISNDDKRTDTLNNDVPRQENVDTGKGNNDLQSIVMDVDTESESGGFSSVNNEVNKRGSGDGEYLIVVDKGGKRDVKNIFDDNDYDDGEESQDFYEDISQTSGNSEKALCEHSKGHKTTFQQPMNEDCPSISN